MQINEQKIINSYIEGQSMTAIAKAHNTFTNTIRRILQKNKVELRHDSKKKGSLCVTGRRRID